MDDAYRVERAIVLFEHLERLVSWAPVGPSFSNSMLQELITAISEPLSSPKGHVLVIATTSKPDVIRRFELEDMFSATLRTRPLSTEEQISFLQSVFEDKPELIANQGAANYLHRNPCHSNRTRLLIQLVSAHQVLKSVKT
jgi:SpoVK/Ycf46/Vps4 family AAA+-type ATPase